MKKRYKYYSHQLIIYGNPLSRKKMVSINGIGFPLKGYGFPLHGNGFPLQGVSING